MKITAVNLYTVDASTSSYGPKATWGNAPPAPGTVSAHPMSIFPEFKYSAVDLWRGQAAYAPFVVEIETDAGVSGFAVNHGGGEISCRIVDEHFRRFIEGRSPFQTNLIWEQMYRAQLPTSQGGLAYMAMSAVDLALWDLKAKLHERPVFDLIGGRTRDAIPCYVTTFPTIMDRMAGKGFKGVKIATPWGPADGREGIDEIEKMIARARDLFGSTTALMLECYMSWTTDFTVKVAERLRAYEIEWIEDPLLADATDASNRELRRQIKPIQLAVGNLMWGNSRFASLINEGAVDVVQPELQWAGGLTEVLRIAALARGRGIPIIPHTAGAYSYQFTMAHVDAPMAEYIVLGDGSSVTSRDGVIAREPVIQDGYVVLDDSPGFGVELDRSLLVPLGSRHDA